jgi:hypothetical protein
MTEHETKQLQEANAKQEEIYARARAAGWEPAYVVGETEVGQPEYGPDAPAPGYVFTREERAVLVRWYPAADASVMQFLDWIESFPRS